MISIVFMMFSFPPDRPACAFCFFGSVLLLCVSYEKTDGISYIAMPQFCHKNATAKAAISAIVKIHKKTRILR